MKKIKISYFIYLIVLFWAMSRCSSKTEETKSEEPADGEVLQLSPEQQKKLKLLTVQPEVRKVSQYVEANGTLDVPPQHLITISAPLGGFVKRTPLLEGMRVRKGDVLVELEHPDYIQLQQDFLQAANRLELLRTEYNRQEELARENITAQKAREKARSDYETVRVEVESLGARLKMLNIDPDVLQKNGIRPMVIITSPINGFVTRVNVTTGAYVPAHHELFRLIDPSHLHAEIFVFEKDLPFVREGQSISFTVLNDTVKRTGKIYLIGKELTSERTVRVHCHLDKDDNNLIPGLYIKARIETASHTALTLPESAVVQAGGMQFVFVKQDDEEFRLMPVVTGVTANGITEIVNPAFSKQDWIVQSPAYTLLAMLRNRGEEE
ncbi:MAG: efflux RND transporter periplasmic adaptor subunit [Cyclobacteriaceae bacterium]|nr:efflux RND transporter periplasmic adaptor subunit [Cyclobacteriaceae bacterium]MCX7636683.1 efflux RND transporter periplasmic adaptor subunit [Cyclobacteriaceae bacterium]MDW8331588.1 efflux RND transporter periplasmic adaptor subunit [Cyclobacteriaceae bacterium]